MAVVLYDGWDLAYHPNSPAALHLLTLLAARPAGVMTLVGLPGRSFHPLDEDLQVHIQETPDSPSGRLRWEQRSLPRIAREFCVNLVHSFSGAALFGRHKVALSPADSEGSGLASRHGEQRPTLAARLRGAMAEGGLVRKGVLFWPADLERLPPWRGAPAPRFSLPPVVHPAFLKEPPSPNGKALLALALPETFILYHGSGEPGSLRSLLGAWSWAAGPIGVDFPLIAVGLSQPECDLFEAVAREYRLEGTVRCLPALPIPDLAAVYRASSAVFHPDGPSPWGGPLRQGLACARPLVGLESPLSDAILGPAGYLVKASEADSGQNRALGAALLTVIVEQGLAEALSQAALRQSVSYSFERFSSELGETYRLLSA
jgi:glycosyltransferase involved in cell wall biosynthesis